jgi:hypothetical protein
MKTLLFGTLGLVLLSFVYQPNKSFNHPEKTSISTISEDKKESVVYICTGPKSYAYHSHSSCAGLNNCSTEIYPVYYSDAINRGRRACKKCY